MATTKKKIPVLITTERRGVFFGYIDPTKRTARTLANALVRARSRSALEPAFASAVQAGIAAWGLQRGEAAGVQ